MNRGGGVQANLQLDGCICSRYFGATR